MVGESGAAAAVPLTGDGVGVGVGRTRPARRRGAADPSRGRPRPCPRRVGTFLPCVARPLLLLHAFRLQHAEESTPVRIRAPQEWEVKRLPRLGVAQWVLHHRLEVGGQHKDEEPTAVERGP